MWDVEPLLRNDTGIGRNTRAVSGQRLGKHVPAAADTNTTIELFSMWSVLSCYKQVTRLEFNYFFTRVCEERT
jgi:hypothetical protein